MLFELLHLIVGGSYIKGPQSNCVTQMIVEVDFFELMNTLTELLRTPTQSRNDFDESQQVSGLGAEEHQKLLFSAKL